MNTLRLLKRIPYLHLIFLLITLAALFEGIGISALIPVLSIATNEGNINEMVFPFNILPIVFNYFHWKININNMLIFVLLLMIISFFFVFLQERFIQFIRYKILFENRDGISTSIFNSDWELGTSFSPGEISNKLIHETDKMTEALLSLVLLISLLFQFFVYTAIAFFLSIKMTLIVFCILIMSFLIIYPLLKRSKFFGSEIVKTNSLFSSQVVDAIKGFKLIKASSLERYIIKKLENINRENSFVSRKILDYASNIKFIIQIFLSIVIVLIAYLSLEIFHIELSKLMVFVLLLIRISPKYSAVQAAFRSYLVHLPALEIVDEMKYASKQFQETNQQTGHKDINKIKSVEFKNVSFKFRGVNKKIIDNFTYKIDANSFTAIVGPSGAGKSTILDILMGLLNPTNGSMLVNDISITEINKKKFRETIGFVPQENMFFNDTIKENLSFDKIYSNDQIHDCLKLAQLYDLVDELPDKLDTIIGEGGVKLSGGQKQRLSIARALLRSPSMLILDEATSSLDSNSEKEFQNALENISSNYTLIVVAHRLSTIQKADNILVLEKGKIIEAGSYKKLSSQEGLFSSMIKTQLIDES